MDSSASSRRSGSGRLVEDPNDVIFHSTGQADTSSGNDEGNRGVSGGSTNNNSLDDTYRRQLLRRYGNNYLNNDSFVTGGTLGNTPVLAATRPFDAREGNTDAEGDGNTRDVERFLTSPDPNSGPHYGGWAGSAPDNAMAENSSFVSIPKAIADDPHSHFASASTSKPESVVAAPAPQRTSGMLSSRQSSQSHADPLSSTMAPTAGSGAAASSRPWPIVADGPPTTSFAETVAPPRSPISIPISEPETPSRGEGRTSPSLRNSPSSFRGPSPGSNHSWADYQSPITAVASSEPILTAGAPLGAHAKAPGGAAPHRGGVASSAKMPYASGRKSPRTITAMSASTNKPLVATATSAGGGGGGGGGSFHSQAPRNPALRRGQSESELQNYFSSMERGGNHTPSTAGGTGAPMLFATQSAATSSIGGGMISPTSHTTPSSSGSKRRAPGTSIATSGNTAMQQQQRRSPTGRFSPGGRVSPPMGGSSTGAGGTYPPKPQWTSAVERLRRTGTDRQLYNPVLPLDQSKLGWDSRKAAQQGTLTAQQLRALEEGYTAGPNHGGYSNSPSSLQRGGGGTLNSYGGGTSGGSARPRSMRSGGLGALVAQEETMQSSANQHRAISEQAGWRRSHISTGRPSSPSNVGRMSPNMIVATEHSTTPVRAPTVASGSVSSRNTTPTGFHAHFHNRIVNAEQKMANLFGPKAPSSQSALPNLFVRAETGAGAGGPVLMATETHAAAPSTQGGGTVQGGSSFGTNRGAGGVGGAGAGGGGGGGDGGKGNGNGDPNGDKKPPIKIAKKDLDNAGFKSEDVKKAMVVAGDDDEREETAFKSRNVGALHAIPWDERTQIPLSGFGTRFFSVLASPRFWEKVDWAFRGAILTILPTMVLALEPATEGIVPKGFASSLAFQAFWITSPTFGGGLRELIIVLKGFSFGLILLLVLIAISPGPAWVSILILFFFTLGASFIAEETKKTVAYVLASSIMQYVTDPDNTHYLYVGNYYICLLVASAFGFAAFLVPFVRWSSNSAKHYISAMGNALSIDVQGTCTSFWCRTPLERELNVMRLRQLRATAEACKPKIDAALDDSDYEPHLGKYRSKMKTRYAFCQRIHNILGSMSIVIELIAENPSLVDTPMCQAFGNAIDDDLAVIASAMDSMILKIVDFHRTVTPAEVAYFGQAREAFQDALSRVREDVILTNEDYETDESDVFLGFFMFSVDELCETIASFCEDPHPPNSLVHALKFPLRDVDSTYTAFKNLFLTLYYRRTIPRRMKESIKLALCMTVPTIFQIYALSNSPTSAMAGASIIALCYNPTGSESFHYATGRLLGTVMGSICALMVVQIANLRRWVLYIFIVLIGFIGAYVQAAPGFYPLGNAICCSMISIITQYRNQDAAITRINQNCFAILIYFAIITVLWPMRGRTKVTMGLDVSLRCLRESVARLLRNLDMPEAPDVVAADVSALLKEMNKKIGQQSRFISGAIEEPTLSSAAYPEEEWRRIVAAEQKLHSALSMMRYAYHNFMSSRADDTTDLSVHWVVLHRIAPHACDLSDLVFAAVDLYLLSLSKATQVPTTHLTKLRAGMMEAHQAILDTYINTIQHTIDGAAEDGDGGDDFADDDDGYFSDGNNSRDEPLLLSGPPTTTNMNRNHGNGSGGAGGDNPLGLGNNDSSMGPAAGSVKKAHFAESDTPGINKSKSDAVNNKSFASRKSGAAGADDDDDDDDGDDDGDGEKKKKKKKHGYLSYNLTKEEQNALKNFVSNRVSNGTFATNATFRTGGATLGNATFSASMGAGATAVSAARAAMASMNGAPQSAAGGAAKIFSVTGTDDNLVSRLRKKHHIDDDKNKDKDKDDGKMDLDQLEALVANNGSFMKNNSFLKNASMWGNFFKKKGKDGTNDSEDGESEMLNRTMRGKPDNKDPLGRTAKGMKLPKLGSASDKASDDDHDDDEERKKKKTKRSASGGDRGEHDDDADDHESLYSSVSQNGERARGRRRHSPDKDTLTDHSRGGTEDEDGEDGAVGGSSVTAKPRGTSAAGSSVRVDTGLVSQGNNLPSVFDVDAPPAAAAAAAAAARSSGAAAAANSGPLAVGSDRHSSSGERSDSTVKKVLYSNSTSDNNNNNDPSNAKSPQKKEADAGSSPAKPGNGSVAKRGANASFMKGTQSGKGHGSSNSQAASSYRGSSVPLMGESQHRYFDDDGDGSSMDPPDGSEILRNVSFFDAEKGEFVLTNHDIHSLEAFLFGTRAVVVYINELQSAIIDMQHASLLAKKL